MIQKLVVTFALCCASQAAPSQASAVTYGSPCNFGPLTVQGLPQLGSTFVVSAPNVGAGNGICSTFLVIGLGMTSTPILIPGFIIGAGLGCSQMVTMDVVIPGPTMTIVIPSQPALAGFQFYVQGVVTCHLFFGGSFFDTLDVTEGLHCTVG